VTTPRALNVLIVEHAHEPEIVRDNATRDGSTRFDPRKVVNDGRWW
jgi:hypothetical protein